MMPGDQQAIGKKCGRILSTIIAVTMTTVIAIIIISFSAYFSAWVVSYCYSHIVAIGVI